MLLLAQCLGAVLLALLAAGLAIRLLYPLPPLEPRPASRHFAETGDTPLAQGTAALRAGHGGLTGVHMLEQGRDAFAARILLARAARRSLDIQYYIWHGDLSGTLLLQAVHQAADRGVRVRMLLDDNGITGLDPVLAALDRHPNIEIRLFNPFVLRTPKMLGYLAEFPRLNRRMHNKSFTADDQVTIIGGRNIGDEYFDARQQGVFADLDVLAIGPVVNAVSSDFDRYWSSQSAYPASRILPPVSGQELTRLAARASIAERDAAAQAYVSAIRELPFIEQVVSGSLPLEWAHVEMVSDDPAKAVGKARKDALLGPALDRIIGHPHKEMRLVSGYFVPTQAGVDRFSALSEQGRDVAIFTNAFEATDVWIVHAGYAERRKALLRAGVRLFEMRRAEQDGAPAARRKFISTGSGSGSGTGSNGPVLRSSSATLHAKTFAIDREKLFIGSFNFDPRSLHLNTELGFVIESPVLAAAISDAFAQDIPNTAYEVILTGDGALNWIERGPDGEKRHAHEPGTNWFQRTGIRILSGLPIEWML
ncbi:phospholipase D family protein [Novosphingobium album (ex Liu et al. 2023)]|uniref:Phospholipase D n=1 Tax=Novosphingobium album (ex Liu et al. 2023) TaxID=3031130 RepID=A0ABT5WKK0_9SPHN|nr:phospholipase D family protein [Novosphingobium album (ex Liu et al. 2023)]MDE8650551.1 phospholipase D family protein [Novosphingobium album (ex Liu et al. 2023)]